MTAEQIAQLIGSLGLPVAILVVLAAWLKPHLDRLISSHLDFVAELKKTQSEMRDMLAALKTEMTVLVDRVTRKD